MTNEPVSVYLGLGSNLGDRQKNLALALDYISQRMRISKKSSIYDTAPVENPDQPRFLNMVVEVETSLQPDKLLQLLKGIEAKMGRVPAKPNSPRPIDIDILFFGDSIWNSPALVIPHPKIPQRAFVLVPLNEIAPILAHPVTKKKVREMLKEINKGVQDVLKFEGEGPTDV